MTFHVNQKVVCVETWNLNGEGHGHEIGPVKGVIYTIKEIGVGLSPRCPDTTAVRLIEIVNPAVAYREGVYEPSFKATRFRPLVIKSTETGMAILRRALEPKQMEVV